MGNHVALDVHARSVYAVKATPDGAELWRRRFPAGREGEEQLRKLLEPGDVVVLEATRGSHRLANWLEGSGAVVRVIDPQQAPSLRTGEQRGKKTDYRDCRALLKDLRSGTLVDVWRPDPETRELRHLTRERAAYNHSITRIKNRLQALLHEEGVPFPGLLLWSQEGHAWLQQQPLRAGTRAILLREWGALRCLLTIKETQEEALQLAALHRPGVVRLMQLAGFAPTAALIVLGEAGDLNRFPSGKHLVSYAGMNPRVYQSGERSKGGSITKAGRSRLRWVMTEVAWAHVIANGPEAGLYHRLVQRGKPKGVAIVALARHLLVLAYHLLQRPEPYRRLEGEQWHRKLTKLASHRPPGERRPAAEARHVDWAWSRIQEITGQDPPSRSKGGRPRLAVDPKAPEPQVYPAPAPVLSSTAAPPPAEDTAGVRPPTARLPATTRRSLGIREKEPSPA